MGVETKNVAINEVSQRNDILTESIDKMRNELLNCRWNLSQAEAEKFDLEKEVLKLRREVKTFEQHTSLLNEEKEHLIQMLELKNSILSSF
jgi:phage shock protein A